MPKNHPETDGWVRTGVNPLLPASLIGRKPPTGTAPRTFGVVIGTYSIRVMLFDVGVTPPCGRVTRTQPRSHLLPDGPLPEVVGSDPPAGRRDSPREESVPQLENPMRGIYIDD